MKKASSKAGFFVFWLREKDLNLRPLGYEPNELPDCSIAHRNYSATLTVLFGWMRFYCIFFSLRLL